MEKTPDTPTAPTRQPKKPRGKHWLRTLVGLAIILTLTAKYWLIPTWIEREIYARITPIYDGGIVIGRIDFNLFTPTRLHNLKLTDNDGQTWLIIDTITATAKNLTSKPVVIDLTFDNTTIWISQDTLNTMPIHQPTTPTTPSDFAINTITFNDTAIGLTNYPVSPTQTIAWQDINAIITHAADGYTFDAHRHKTNTQLCQFTGRYDPATRQTQMNLAIHHRITPAEASAVITILDLKDHPNLEGTLEVDLASEGPIDDPHSLWPVGQIALDGWKLQKGTLNAIINLDGPDPNSQGPLAQGECFIDDAHLSATPHIAAIFAKLGFGRYNPTSISDACASFTLTGDTLTLQSAQLANPIGAIQARPNGTIDLATGQLDLYIVGIPFKRMHKIIDAIPIINLLTRFQNALTQLHIQGHWSDPPAKLIRKEPLKDAKHITIDFFKDTAKQGGQLSRATLNLLKPKKKTPAN